VTVVDRLTRAADLIEKQTQGAGGPRGRWYSGGDEYVWLGNDERIDAGNEWDADYFATFEPAAVAALVPALRWAAGTARADNVMSNVTGSERRAVACLAEFARRLLREEEAP
jgi:hypothetical protein